MAQPMNKTSMMREIKTMDRETLAERVSRGLELEQMPEGEDGLLIAGSVTISYALREARMAFLHGFWVSAILTSLTAIEHHMAALYDSEDPINSKIGPLMPTRDQIDQLRQRDMIDDDERERLLKVFEYGDLYRQPQSLRDLSRRNDEALEKGLIEMADDFGPLMEMDARFIVTEMVEYFYRHCSVQAGSLIAEHLVNRRRAGGPVMTMWNEDEQER